VWNGGGEPARSHSAALNPMRTHKLLLPLFALAAGLAAAQNPNTLTPEERHIVEEEEALLGRVLAALRARFEAGLRAAVPDVVIHGEAAPRLPKFCSGM